MKSKPLLVEDLIDKKTYLVRKSYDAFYSMEYDKSIKGFWFLGDKILIENILEIFENPV